jgi:RNA polymerase sigma-70 factor (ECF subfamily)
VARAQQGDRSAFDELVRECYQPVLRIARGFAAFPEDAHDLAQEALIAAYEHLGTLERPDRFDPWLTAIVRNAGRTWARRRRVQPPLLSLDGPNPDRVSTPPDAGAEAMACDGGRDTTREYVLAAINALPAGQRQACRLHYLLGYDYAETSALLGISVSAVRGRLQRARQGLRKELDAMTRQTEWVLAARDLAALRAAAAFAARPEHAQDRSITGMCFDESGRLVSSDTFRLFCYRSRALEGMPSTVVDAELGLRLRNDHPDARNGCLTLGRREARLNLAGAAGVRAEILPESYPPWENVLPESWKLTTAAPAGDWLRALDMLRQGWATLTDGRPEARRILMILSPDESRITLARGREPSEGHGVTWECSASFGADFTEAEEKVVIAANGDYVLQAIRALDAGPDEQLELAANGPAMAFMLRPAGRDDIFVVTMPMSRPTRPSQAGR